MSVGRITFENYGPTHLPFSVWTKHCETVRGQAIQNEDNLVCQETHNGFQTSKAKEILLGEGCALAIN